MAGTGRVQVTSATAVGYNQYDVTVKFDIAFNYGGWNSSGASYTVYCNGQSQSGKATFSISSGGGSWVWGNIASKKFRITMPTSGKSYSIGIAANINTGVNPGYIEAKGSYTLPARTWQWTVSYNANGGSGAPGSQTKTYGSNLTLSSGRPTRTGYTFQGWATSSGGGVAYQPGSTYTSNSSITLYAVWKANTYTVSYNANGGTGAPGNQTKTYGKTLVLSSTRPTRTNYNFLGWGTTASSTTVSYNPGSNYTSNSGITLYAIWQLAYTAPRINNFELSRINDTGVTTDDTGEYFQISFDYETDKPITIGKMEYKETTATDYSQLMSLSIEGKTSGHFEYAFTLQRFSAEKSWDIRIFIADSVGDSKRTGTLPPMRFIIDCLAGGNGVSFGKPATLDGVADFGFKTRFSGGFDEIPILENADLNDIKTSGYYVCTANAVVETLSNCPVQEAFVLEVLRHSGVHQRLTIYKHYDVHTYVRNFYSDIWSPWQIVMNTELLEQTTNLNTVMKPGVYYSKGGNPNTPTPAVNKGSFSLEVLPSGPDGQLLHRFVLCDKTASMVCHRFYYKDSWGEWSIFGNSLIHLWSGGWYMNGGHSAELSEPISSQQYGIVLVWSEYANGKPYNDQWHSFFVPKSLITGGFTQNRVNFIFSGYGSMQKMASKTVTIHDTKITGYDENQKYGTNSGITYDNRHYVLRFVFGM